MTQWIERIPAKTFLIGEYAALFGDPAIVFTTKPYFRLEWHHEKTGLEGIHEHSPAGLLWRKHPKLREYGITWHCPYNDIGGLGASSAQFIGMYRLLCKLSKRAFSIKSLLSAYFDVISSMSTQKPSGYDVLAQSLYGFSLISDLSSWSLETHWPFSSHGLLLFHMNQKMATHTHLETWERHWDREAGKHIVMEAMQAFKTKNGSKFIEKINDYRKLLKNQGLVAPHTQHYIDQFLNYPGVRAIKGCGAMGADVLMLIVDKADKDSVKKALFEEGLVFIGCETSTAPKTLIDHH